LTVTSISPSSGNISGGTYVTVHGTGFAAGLRAYVGDGRAPVRVVDATTALILGADPGATMPQPGIDHLARIPTIVLDPKVTHTSRLARVHITTAVTGISATGTAYRMDEIPLPLRPALRSPYPTDEDVIRRIRQAVAAMPEWSPATARSAIA